MRITSWHDWKLNEGKREYSRWDRRQGLELAQHQCYSPRSYVGDMHVFQRYKWGQIMQSRHRFSQLYLGRGDMIRASISCWRLSTSHRLRHKAWDCSYQFWADLGSSNTPVIDISLMRICRMPWCMPTSPCRKRNVRKAWIWTWLMSNRLRLGKMHDIYTIFITAKSINE